MNKSGEIILVEDDIDDQELILEAITELQLRNNIKIFSNGAEAYNYLNNQDKDPFIIVSDINMPLMNGIELRDKMQKEGELRLRTIPFLFMTTAAAKDSLINAYAHSVQGFFKKPNDFEELKRMLKTILSYWETCTEPTFN